MCGISGIWDTATHLGPETLGAGARRMAATLRHRGPDDSGTFVDAEAGVAFGHRRLCVIDLSPEGHQPMVSAGGRYVIAFMRIPAKMNTDSGRT